MASPKRCSPTQAAGLVRPRDTLAIPLGPGQPAAFLHALGERDDFEDLQVFGALLIGLFKVFTRRGVHLRSGFFGPVERGLRQAGFDVQFVPADFRRFSHIARDFHPRILASIAAPPDEKGMISFGLYAGAGVEEIFRAARDPERLLVIEINPNVPRTSGLPPEHPHAIHVDQVDILVESDAPVFEIAEQPATEVERAIASVASRFIPDGATLQTGIGGIPSAVAEILAAGSGGDYGLHTEMFTTGCMRLHKAGKVTNRKGQYDGFSVATFAAGTRELYDWLDGNEDVRFLPVEYVNDPSLIARNRRFICINGALAVDLVGQVAADTIDGRQFSGIGGHEDFLQGAAYSEGGRALVCLPSTAKVGDRVISRIQTGFAEGAVVTGPRHQVDVIITEHGAAELAGRTVDERAEALIAVAAPQFRDALRAARAK
jgi:acyl-CoA hydrolase